jgi:hypothetical protein
MPCQKSESDIAHLRHAQRRAYDEGVSCPHREAPAIAPGFSFQNIHSSDL